MLSILKWFSNPNSANPNRIHSRTLGKVAFVDSHFHGPQPRDGEFWLSDITTEIATTKGVGGCFLAEPFQEVLHEDLVRLNRLNCTINRKDKYTITIEPATANTPEGRVIPWILPLTFRQELLTSDIAVIVVNLGGNWWKQVVK